MGFKTELECNEKRKLDDRMQPAKEMAEDQDAEEEAQAAAMEEINKLNKLTRTTRVISLKSSKKTKMPSSSCVSHDLLTSQTNRQLICAINCENFSYPH